MGQESRAFRQDVKLLLTDYSLPTADYRLRAVASRPLSPIFAPSKKIKNEV
jgi:hypothetical protein